jgi:hypothetical protein
MRVPAASARRPIVSYAMDTSRTFAPSDMEMTRQPPAMAQLTPARIVVSVPEPRSLRTLPTTMSAVGATP